MISGMIPSELIHEITDDNEFANLSMQSYGFGDINIDQSDKLIVANLSTLNVTRLKKMVTDLRETGQLTRDTFLLALHRVTLKNPPAPQSQIISKTKRATANLTRQTLNNGMSFLLHPGASRDTRMQGKEGYVNRAYSGTDILKENLRVKRYKKNDQVSDPKAFAQREARFCQLLGNQASWYMSKRGPVVVANWQEGVSLDQFDTGNMSYKHGFKLLASFSAIINHVHKHNRILGEIKTANIIVNEDTMVPIDYTAAHKVGSQKALPFTPGYIDPNEGIPRVTACDMYALQFVVAHIFKKLFAEKDKMMQQFFMGSDNNRFPCQMMKCYIEIMKTENYTTTELAAIHLLEALREPIAENRCTSEQVMQYCELIVAKIDGNNTLAEKDLQEILEKTLNRKTFTVEDALRGSRRPAKFAEELNSSARNASGKSSQSGFTTFNSAAKKKPKVEDSQSVDSNRMDFSN